MLNNFPAYLLEIIKLLVLRIEINFFSLIWYQYGFILSVVTICLSHIRMLVLLEANLIIALLILYLRRSKAWHWSVNSLKTLLRHHHVRICQILVTFVIDLLYMQLLILPRITISLVIKCRLVCNSSLYRFLLVSVKLKWNVLLLLDMWHPLMLLNMGIRCKLGHGNIISLVIQHLLLCCRLLRTFFLVIILRANILSHI